MPDPRSNYFLALETAVGGGSIVLFDGPVVIDHLVGSEGISRAEDLLPNIEELLRANDISSAQLHQIVVGAGPGSFTGIRIGIATASGLATALGIPVRLISTLAAVAATSTDNEVTVVLPIGRDTVCLQSFSKRDGRMYAAPEAEVVTPAELIRQIQEDQSRKFILHASLFDIVPIGLRSNLVNSGEDLATFLGRLANAGQSFDLAAPTFIGKRN